MAARRECAAVSAADNRVSQHCVRCAFRAHGRCFSAGVARDRLCGGTKHYNRVSLGRRSHRSITGACDRFGEPSGRSNRRYRRASGGASVAEIDAAFASLKQQAISALFVANDPYLDSQRDQIITLAAHNAIPAMYYTREYAVAGGLISYGANLADAYRQAGVYCGKILKGGKPGGLRVLQPNNFELIINLKAAKTLGLEVPPQLIALADEVIE